MQSFATSVLTAPVPVGQVGVFFLGQAGFLLKSPSGRLYAIDPYLSNCCERYFGFKRLMPQILDATDLTLDALVVSHAHYDHFDPDSVPTLLANPKTELIAAKDVKAECDRLGLCERITYLGVGDAATVGELTVLGLPCDHGELAPDALGLLLTLGEKRIYFMGDTAYRPDLLENSALQDVDLLILPINGAFGNLNEDEAASVVKRLKPRRAVPCHYWNFAEHGGSPCKFQEAMKDSAIPYTLMRQGEGMII